MGCCGALTTAIRSAADLTAAAETTKVAAGSRGVADGVKQVLWMWLPSAAEEGGRHSLYQ